MLNRVERTADQNPIWLTDLGMVQTEATETCPLPSLMLVSFAMFISSSFDLLFLLLDK